MTPFYCRQIVLSFLCCLCLNLNVKAGGVETTCVIDCLNRTFRGTFAYYGHNSSSNDVSDTFIFRRAEEQSGGNEMASYCVQVTTDSVPGRIMPIVCQTTGNAGSLKTFDNSLECAGEKGDLSIFRNYVSDIPSGQDIAVEVSLDVQEGLEPACFDYSLEFKAVQPVIFIHDLGDGPDGQTRSESQWSGQLREQIPWASGFEPNMVHEFLWCESEAKSFSDYAGPEENQLGGYVKSISLRYARQPVIIAQGAGGLIVVEELWKDRDFLDKVKKVIFCATPFWGTDVATVIQGLARASKKGDSRNGISLPEFLGSGRETCGYHNISPGLLEELGRANSRIWRRLEMIRTLPLDNPKMVFISFNRGWVSYDDLEDACGIMERKAAKLFVLTGGRLEKINKTIDICTKVAQPRFTKKCRPIPTRWTMEWFSIRDVEARNLLIESLVSKLYLEGDGVVSLPSADIYELLHFKNAKSIQLVERDFPHDKMLELFGPTGVNNDRKEIYLEIMDAINQ